MEPEENPSKPTFQIKYLFTLVYNLHTNTVCMSTLPEFGVHDYVHSALTHIDEFQHTSCRITMAMLQAIP